MRYKVGIKHAFSSRRRWARSARMRWRDGETKLQTSPNLRRKKSITCLKARFHPAKRDFTLPKAALGISQNPNTSKRKPKANHKTKASPKNKLTKRCQKQRHHNPTEGGISPSERGFHLPKGDFTPAKGRDFTK